MTHVALCGRRAPHSIMSDRTAPRRTHHPTSTPRSVRHTGAHREDVDADATLRPTMPSMPWLLVPNWLPVDLRGSRREWAASGVFLRSAPGEPPRGPRARVGGTDHCPVAPSNADTLLRGGGDRPAGDHDRCGDASPHRSVLSPGAVISGIGAIHLSGAGLVSSSPGSVGGWAVEAGGVAVAARRAGRLIARASSGNQVAVAQRLAGHGELEDPVQQPAAVRAAAVEPEHDEAPRVWWRL